jgi:hypothetical protein
VLSCDIVIDSGLIVTHICTEFVAGASGSNQALLDTCNSSAGAGQGASASPCPEGEVASCKLGDPGMGLSAATVYWYPGRDTQGRPAMLASDGLRESCEGIFTEGSGALADPPAQGGIGGATPTNTGTTPVGNVGYWGSCRQDLGAAQLCTEYETTGSVPEQLTDSLDGLCTPAGLQSERCSRTGAVGACELRTAVNSSASVVQRVFSYGVSADVARSSCSGGTFLPLSG